MRHIFTRFERIVQQLVLSTRSRAVMESAKQSARCRGYVVLGLLVLIGASCAASKGVYPITVSKGVCYGQCPVFSVTVFPNGTIAFDGKHYTKAIGKVSSKLTRQEHKKLADAFEKIELEQLNTVYDERLRDVPETILQYNNKQVHFKKMSSVPKNVRVFVEKLDSTLQAKQWLY